MISLKKAATELDRLYELQQATIECYILAIAASAQYVIEIDRSQAAEYRGHLQALEKMLRSGPDPAGLRQVVASFRGELRDYRDHSHAQLDKLRQEVTTAAAAVHSLADNVATNGSDHEKEMARELRQLEGIARLEDVQDIRAQVQTVIANMALSLDQMRRANQLVIAQLQDEIRLLHQTMQSERSSANRDRASGAWNRQVITDRIDEMVRLDESFCLLMIDMRNLKRLEGRYSRSVIENVLAALISRFHNILGPDAMIGRWAEDLFAAILPMQPSDAMTLSREVAQKLSGAYSVQENGLAQSVPFQVTAGIAERRTGIDHAKFYRKVEQLAAALAEA